MVQTVGLVRGRFGPVRLKVFSEMMHARGYPTTVEHASEAIHRAASAIADDWVHGDSPSIRTYGITSLNERFDHAGIEDLGLASIASNSVNLTIRTCARIFYLRLP